MQDRSCSMKVGDRVVLSKETAYDHNAKVFEWGRYNQLMQQYCLEDNSPTALNVIRHKRRAGKILKIEEWGRCPIWYGKDVAWETELCAHVQFSGETKRHIVMLCHLSHDLRFFDDLLLIL